MNEQKDDLLAAFENPDMQINDTFNNEQTFQNIETPSVQPSHVQSENTQYASIQPSMQQEVQSGVNIGKQVVTPLENVMPQSLQSNYSQTPEVVSFENESVSNQNNQVMSEYQKPDASTVLNNSVENNQINQDNPNASEQINIPNESNIQNIASDVAVEPAVNVTQTIKNDVVDDNPTFLKKNIVFLIILFIIIVAFIIFLPQIRSIISGSSY